MSNNPFTVGQPVSPEHFVGRASELAAAFDQIYNRSSMAIWGGPGMGKSSFLKQLASPQVWEKYGQDPSKAVIVLFSCESIRPFSPEGFWREVLSLMKDKLDSELTLQAEIEALLKKGLATKEGLRQVLRKLGQQKKFLVLLVDDFDAALRPNERYTEANMETFLSECRNLAYQSQERKHLAMIVTSLKRLNELGPKLNPGSSPWYNHYLFQSLKPFTNTEIDQLLGIPQTPDLRDAIRDIADGHPTLLQIAGSLLYRELKVGQGQAPDTVTFAKNFENMTQQFFQTIWQRCSNVEQILLMLMALSGLKSRLHKRSFDLSGIELVFSQRERELTNLEEQGVIVSIRQDGKKEYAFTSSIMERLVIQEIWNTDEPSLQNRQKVFLNLMSHEQAKNVTTAIRWLWQHKDEVASTGEWFGKVSAAFPKGTIQGLFNWS
jgi:hypothetical protein